MDLADSLHIIGPPGHVFEHLTAEPNLARLLFSGGSKTSIERAILNFDVSALSGLDYSGAVLHRNIENVIDGGGDLMQIARCTRPNDVHRTGAARTDWVEYDHGTPNAWTSSGGGGDFVDAFRYDAASATGAHEITDAGLETLVEDAVDNRSGILSIFIMCHDERDVGDDRGEWWTGVSVGDALNPYIMVNLPAEERPPRSGIAGAQLFTSTNKIDPLLAIRPEGGHVRALRLARREVSRRLRE